MRYFAYAIAMFMLSLVSFSAISVAEESNGAAPNVRIAVVDVSALLKDSKAAESIQEQVAKKRKEYQGQIGKLEEKLKATEKQLLELRKNDDAEGFGKKRKDFEEQFRSTQEEVQELRSKLDKGFAKGMAELRQNIVEIVADIAKENTYNLVVSRQEVVIVSKDLDITEDVLKRLNKDLPKVKVSFK